MKKIRAGDVDQWYSTYLACTRERISSSVPQEGKEGEKEGGKETRYTRLSK